MKTKRTTPSRQKKSTTHFPIQTYTYFIPTPAQPRRTGYREKEFDKIFSLLVQAGFELIEMKLATTSGGAQPGCWVFCLIRPLHKKAASLSLNENFPHLNLSENPFDELELPS